MARVVFILGAGASKHAGAPLMNEFLESAWDLQRAYDSEIDWLVAPGPSFDLVRRGVDELQKAHSKSNLDIWNVETVFDAFEMAALVGRLGDLPPEDVQRLPEAMRELIVETIERRVRLPVERSDESFRQVLPPLGYRRFVDAFKGFHRATGSYPAVITFNYDVCLDLAVQAGTRLTTYCLDGTIQPNAVAVMKLHGSLNWTYCQGCFAVDAYRLQPHHLFVPAGDNSVSVRVAPEAVRKPCPECGKQREVLIVPPTLSKAQHHQKLRPVWDAAARALGEAEYIFVCGYSLPETDLFFRYLFAVGTIGGATLRRFWVWDPNPKEVRARFERLLGQQVLAQTGRFDCREGKFEHMDWATLASDLAGHAV